MIPAWIALAAARGDPNGSLWRIGNMSQLLDAPVREPVPNHPTGVRGRVLGRRAPLVIAVLGVAVLALWIELPAGAPSLAPRDPERTAQRELAMWQAYYAKEKLRLFALLLWDLREQHGYSLRQAAEVGFHLARAAARFGDMRAGARASATEPSAGVEARGSAREQNYESVLPDLERAYELLKAWTRADFDPREVARAELAWWVARRVPGRDSAEQVGALIGAEYVALYGARIDRAGALRAGTLRAQAAKLRDTGGANADWRSVGELLSASYRTLHEAQLPSGLPRAQPPP